MRIPNSAMLPPSFPNLYAVLGLKISANPSGERIRRSYLRRCRRVYPDKGDFHDSFLKAKHAYDVLSDPDRKAEYDYRYELEQDRDAAISEYRQPTATTISTPSFSSTTTAALRPSPGPTSKPTSRPSPSIMSTSDSTQLQPPAHPDFIAEAYKRGMPPQVPQDPWATPHPDLLIPTHHGTFPPHIAAFLNLAAHDGLRHYHDPEFQNPIDQRCREVGRGLVGTISRAEAGKRVEDALQGWEELWSGFLTGVVMPAAPHLLYLQHPLMRGVYRAVAGLGYLGESLRGLRRMIGRVDKGEEKDQPRGPMCDDDDDALVLGSLEAHRDTGRELAVVLERLMRLAGGLAAVGHGADPKKGIWLRWTCGELRNWPGVLGEM